MSTHLPIHRLAATGGALLALAAALPAGASAHPADRLTPTAAQAIGPAVQPNPDNRPVVREPVPAVTPQPNPDEREVFPTPAPAAGSTAGGGGEVLPHTNWLTPAPTPAAQAPRHVAFRHAPSTGGVSLVIPLGFAGVVVLAAAAAGVTRRRRGVRIPA
jgi:hypothetical protein